MGRHLCCGLHLPIYASMDGATQQEVMLRSGDDEIFGITPFTRTAATTQLGDY